MSLLQNGYQDSSFCNDHQDDTPYYRPVHISQTVSSFNIGNEKLTYKWKGAVIIFWNIIH